MIEEKKNNFGVGPNIRTFISECIPKLSICSWVFFRVLRYTMTSSSLNSVIKCLYSLIKQLYSKQIAFFFWKDFVSSTMPCWVRYKINRFLDAVDISKPENVKTFFFIMFFIYGAFKKTKGNTQRQIHVISRSVYKV